MHPQVTTSAMIEAEKQTVRQHLGLPSTNELLFIDSGWDSRVYVDATRHIVFKFPRSAKVKARFAAQIDACNLAQGIADGVRIPDVQWVAQDYSYFGYSAIVGDPLSRIYSTLSVTEKHNVGEKLGIFLHAFHCLTLENARDMRIENEIDQVQRWFKMGRPHMSQVLTADTLQKLDYCVGSIWPALYRKQSYVETLSHGDFHFDNILIDSDGTIGIIDFGDVCIADESRDYAYYDDTAIMNASLRILPNPSSDLTQKILLRKHAMAVITLTAQLIKGRRHEAAKKAQEITKSLKYYCNLT